MSGVAFLGTNTIFAMSGDVARRRAIEREATKQAAAQCDCWKQAAPLCERCQPQTDDAQA